MKQEQHHQRTSQHQHDDSSQRRNLIVGGHNIEPRRYPYFVSIDKNNGVIVNGALIAPDIVLSAGHIALDQMDNLTIKIGPYAVHDETEPFAETIQCEEYLVPDTWRFMPMPGFFHDDLMILKLAQKSNHTPVKINRNPAVPRDGQMVVMTGLGWLNQSYLSPASIVQEVQLMTVGNDKCRAATDPSRGKSYAQAIDDSMICTTSPPNTTRDGCAWDSGAPVIVAGSTPGKDILVGLGSSGVSCADAVFPATQARVATPFGLSWIRAQVCRLSVDPPDDFHCDTTNIKTNTTSGASLTAALTTGAIAPPPSFGSMMNTDSVGSGSSMLFLAGCLVTALLAVFIGSRRGVVVKAKIKAQVFAQDPVVSYGAMDS